MAQKIGGTCTIHLDGRAYTSEGNFTIKIQDVMKETVTTDNPGIVLFKNKIVYSTIEGTLFLMPDMNPDEISQMEDGTVVVVTKSGKTATLRNAVFTGDASVTGQDGTMAVQWTGLGKWT